MTQEEVILKEFGLLYDSLNQWQKEDVIKCIKKNANITAREAAKNAIIWCNLSPTRELVEETKQKYIDTHHPLK